MFGEDYIDSRRVRTCALLEASEKGCPKNRYIDKTDRRKKKKKKSPLGHLKKPP